MTTEAPAPTPLGPGPARSSPEGSAERREVLATLRENWAEEMHSAGLYRRLAGTQPDGGDASVLLLEMAEQEVRHADHWRHRIEELGGRTPRLRPGLRELALPLLARVTGIASVISFIEGGEAEANLNYLRQARNLPDERSREIAARLIPEERVHHDAAARLRIGDRGAPARAASAYIGDVIRDLIFGLNDGLVSNFVLIAGVAGAGPPRAVVLLAGVAGLIAGAVSMAAGSYLSNKSQREVVDGEVRRKAEEIEYDPEAEREELRRIYRLKGFSEDEVEILVRRISADPDRWLDALVGEELGLSRQAGPPPLLDALFTGGGFAVAATVPLIPFLVSSGTGALIAAAVLSVAFSFAVGAAKSLVTARGAVRTGLEMVVVVAGTAIVANLVGRLFGSAVG
jgi:VIT1/CCC1 family predicted Fe2+/Mn2+ transporter/rubrerythrin